MKNKLSLFFVLITALVAVFSFASVVSADEPIEITEMSIYVKGDLVWFGRCNDYSTDPIAYPLLSSYPDECEIDQLTIPSIERGETIPVKVVFESNTHREEIYVKAWINGYREDIEDRTNVFDIFEDHSYSKKLYLDIPEDVDAKDEYTLHVELVDKTMLSGVSYAEIELQVQKLSNALEIKSVEFYSGLSHSQCDECSDEFETGSILYADVVVKNRGSQTQKDVYVKMSIPESYIDRTIYVGDLESGESEMVTLYITLPEEAGAYTLLVEAMNDDTHTEVEQTINVEGSVFGVEILPQTTFQEVEQGNSAVYSLYVVNLGSSETFIVSVEGIQGWATAQVSPSTFTLGEDGSQMVNIELTVDGDAFVAEHQFTVKVKYGDKTESYNFSANVTEKPGFDELKALLLVIGIILAIAIIILLILLISKNSKTGIEKPEEEYSYY